MTTTKSHDRKARQAQRKQRQHRRTAKSNKHAAVTQHKNFGYTRRQNMRWLQDQYDLPDHGGIAKEPAFELARYFNVRDEEELRNVRLSEETAVVLARLEEERQLMREARGVAGRLRDWWMAPMMQEVEDEEGVGDEEGQCLVMEGGEDEEEGGMALGGEECIWRVCSPVMMSPVR